MLRSGRYIGANMDNKPALVFELCEPAQTPRWAELGYAVQGIYRTLVDECEAEPAALEQKVRAQLTADPALLVLACDRLPATRAADTQDWQPLLHQPLTRCFTVIRGLVPWLAAHSQRSHVVALLARAALLPDANPGSAGVLGRALVGLFEGLRAELRLTTTRVTLVITDPEESSQAFHARLRHVLARRPLYSLPESVDRRTVEQYFAPLLDALARTPLGIPLPAGPQGEVYHSHQLEDPVTRA